MFGLRHTALLRALALGCYLAATVCAGGMHVGGHCDDHSCAVAEHEHACHDHDHSGQESHGEPAPHHQHECAACRFLATVGTLEVFELLQVSEPNTEPATNLVDETPFASFLLAARSRAPPVAS